MPDPAPAPSSPPNPSASPPPVAADGARPPSEPISRSVPCLTCGYDLRGLQPTGACPECNRDIAESLRGDWLRYADPRWFHGIELGARLSVDSRRAIGYGFLALVVDMFIALPIGFMGAEWLLGILVSIIFYVASAVIVFGVIGIIVCQWLTAAADPSDQSASAWISSVTYALIGCAPVAAFGLAAALRRGAPATLGSFNYYVELACVLVLWAHIVSITLPAWRLRRRCRASLEHFQWRRERPAAPIYFWPGAFIIADALMRSTSTQLFGLFLFSWVVAQFALVGWNKHIIEEASAAKQLKEQRLIAESGGMSTES